MALAVLNFLLMTLLSVTVFGVPVKGGFITLLFAAVVFSFCSTGLGLLASSVTKSQVAAMFFAMVGTVMPAMQFSGMNDPVSSLQGGARMLGQIYPATHMIDVSRGVFNKALHFGDLVASLIPMLIAAPLIVGASILLLRKQER